jgi:hypothetical protein
MPDSNRKECHMRNLKALCACLWAAMPFLCTGCLVQSINPFYVAASKVALPEAAGKWHLVKERGQAVDKSEPKPVINPWTISAGEERNGVPYYAVTSFDRSNREGKLYATFFTVDGETYCNVTPAPLSDANQYWRVNTIQVQLLCKVELKDDVLKLRQINRQWLEKALESKEVAFRVVRTQRSSVLLNATPEEWKAFLEKYGKTEGVFTDQSLMELHRLKENQEKKDF